MYTNQIIGILLIIISALVFLLANYMPVKRGYTRERAAKALLALTVSIFMVGILFTFSEK